MMSFNCRSLRLKVPQVLDMAIENEVDILLLQETWLRKSDTALITQIQEYKFHIVQVRKSRKIDIGGGVAIVYNSNLKMKQLRTEKFSSFEVVICALEAKAEKIFISTLYYPGYSTKHKYTHSQFLSELSDFLNSLCVGGIHVITGDFNIHYEALERYETKQFCDILQANALNQLVTDPTHTAKGILDLVLISDSHESLVHNLQVSFCNELSDHNSIFFSLNVKAEVKPTKVSVTTRNLALIDLEKFQQLIKESLSFDNFEQLTLDQCIEMYNSTIKQSLNGLAPAVERMIKPRPNQPWFNSELKLLKRKKRQAERKLKKCHSQVNLQNLNKQKHIYFSTLKLTRIEYNAKVLSLSYRDNPKAFYHHVQRLSGDIPPVTLPSKYSITELPNIFADYFETKICNIRSNLGIVTQLQNQTLSDSANLDRISPLTPCMFKFHDVTEDNFNLVVSKLTNKDYMFVPAPVSLLKSCPATIFSVLHYIVCRSFNEGVFPEDLKHATITPITKNSNLDPDDLKSY